MTKAAKIGGEMVSLAAVEALAQELWPDAASAVVALPDRRKGERVVLVTTALEARREMLTRQAKSKDASELVVPAEIISVDELPVLGSGKTDHGGCAGSSKRGRQRPRRSKRFPSDTRANDASRPAQCDWGSF